MARVLTGFRSARRFSLFRWVSLMRSVARNRAALADLDDARLADLGIDRATAQAEARRKPWDVPDHWRL